jgi:PHD/YefM family antitoxin component YafN of YafNO toxin-antitoxin module
MSIELTKEQQRQLDASDARPPEVVDPRGQRKYVLVPAEEYDALRDERDQAALRQTSLRNLAGRLKEDE